MASPPGICSRCQVAKRLQGQAWKRTAGRRVLWPMLKASHLLCADGHCCCSTGLTNMMWMRPKAAVVQLTPYGWCARSACVICPITLNQASNNHFGLQLNVPRLSKACMRAGSAHMHELEQGHSRPEPLADLAMLSSTSNRSQGALAGANPWSASGITLASSETDPKSILSSPACQRLAWVPTAWQQSSPAPSSPPGAQDQCSALLGPALPMCTAAQQGRAGRH